jgi:hypothetical protein
MTEVWSQIEAVETTSSDDSVDAAVEAAVDDELAAVSLSELHAAKRVPPISNDAAIKVILVFFMFPSPLYSHSFLKNKMIIPYRSEVCETKNINEEKFNKYQPRIKKISKKLGINA